MTAIVVDTSAIIAIPRDEPERDRFVDTILAASPRFMSAVSLQEAGIVMAGRFGDGAASEAMDALLSRLDGRSLRIMRSSPGSRGRYFSASARAGIPLDRILAIAPHAR